MTIQKEALMSRDEEQERAYELASAEVVIPVTRDEANAIASALDILAGIDEGENTDTAELIRLRDLVLAQPGVH
jgi:hypothetical protein